MPGRIGSSIFILLKHEKRCYSFSTDLGCISAGATKCEAGDRRDSPDGHGGRARHGPGNCPRSQSPLPDPCRYGTFACSGRYGQGSGVGSDFPESIRRRGLPSRRVRLPRVARYARYFPKNADRNEHGRPAGRGSRQAQALGNRCERRVCSHASGYETVY